MGIGLWVWPAFAALDAFMCFVAYPGAPFPLFLLYRALVEVAFLAVYRLARREGSDLRRLFWGLNVSFGLAAIAISLMAIHLGGIRSPYMHGISIIALVRAATVPMPWRRALPTYARIALAFPVVMGLGGTLSTVLRADWLNADALVVFGSNYVFVLASAFLGLTSGHVTWRAQEQLYQARRVGRYRLRAPVGKGGMGEVWLAWDTSLRRNVALKLVRAGSAGPETIKRFEREAMAAGQLRGPHVAQIFDVGGSDDGLHYIAMEYLTGMDLGTMVETFGPLPPARATHFALQACAALEEAHAAGIIHRDLKPHNLFATRVGTNPDFLKLLDFGIARLEIPEPGAEHLTATGLLIGTPAYLAPELWWGAHADARTDIYALGVTLHYLLTGTTPAFGRSPTPQEAPAAAAQRPPDLRVPEELRETLDRCLAPAPEDRIGSARELREALSAAHDPGAWTAEHAEAFWRAADRARFG